jgi:hypothetical protein
MNTNEEPISMPTIPQPITQPLLTNSTLSSSTDNIITRMSEQLVQLFSNELLQTENDRFLYDASNNVILFETFIRPRSQNNR